MKYTQKQIIDLIKTRLGKPLIIREIMRQLKLTADDRRELKQVLNDLVLSGEIIRTRGNRYGLPEKMDLETGIFQAHPQGYGFVMPGKKGKTDIYISSRSRIDAMDGDKVVARVTPAAGKWKISGKREGVIIRILERARTKVVGTYDAPGQDIGGYGFVTPFDAKLNQDIVVSRNHAGGAVSGDIVSVEIIAYPMHGRPPEGRIAKVIGKPGQPGIDSDL